MMHNYTVYGYKQPNHNISFNGNYRVSNNLYLMGNGYRLYNPTIRKFYSADSIAPSQIAGMNPYAFVKNDPVNYNDPTGHMPNPAGATKHKQLDDIDDLKSKGIVFTERTEKVYRLDFRKPEIIIGTPQNRGVGFQGSAIPFPRNGRAFGDREVYVFSDRKGIDQFLKDTISKDVIAFNSIDEQYVYSIDPKAKNATYWVKDNRNALSQHFANIPADASQREIQNIRTAITQTDLYDEHEMRIQGPIDPEHISFVEHIDEAKIQHQVDLIIADISAEY